MKILVTGAGGYIGSSLCELLTRNDSYKVHGIDNFMYKHEKSIYHLFSRPNFSIEKRDVGGLGSEDLGYDFIIHLAALVGEPICKLKPDEATRVNYEATRNLAKWASPNTKMLIATTNSSYGKSESICTEETPFNPISHYAKTKVDAEKAILDRGGTSFRLATVFGPSYRMRMDLMVNNFVGNLYFNGEMKIFEPHFKRNFVSIQDVCRVFHYGFNLEGIYNVGLDDANCSKWELAQLVKKLVKPDAKIEVGEGQDTDQRDYMVSSEKIRSTGFVFKNGLEAGIKQVHKMCQLSGRTIMNERIC